MKWATKIKLEAALTTLLRDKQDDDTVTEVVRSQTGLNVRLMRGKLQLLNRQFTLIEEADVRVILKPDDKNR